MVVVDKQINSIPQKIEERIIPIEKTSKSTFMKILPYLFIIPSFTLILVFVYFPILISLMLSTYINPNPGQFANPEYYQNTDNLNNASVGVTIISILTRSDFFTFFFVIFFIFMTLIVNRILKLLPLFSKNLQRKGVSFFFALLINAISCIYIFQILALNIAFATEGVQAPIGNYSDVLTNRNIIGNFLRILLNTVLWAFICTFFHVTIGIFLAVLLNQKYYGTNTFRTILILPWAIPNLITALVWKNFIFDYQTGLVGRMTRGVPRDAVFMITILDVMVFILAIVTIILIITSKFEFLDKKLVRTGLILFVIFITISVFRIHTANIPIVGSHFVKIDNISPQFFFTSDFHILNYQTKTIFLSAILTNIWLGVPFMMLSFLASLQSIPNDLYEAAEIDGTSDWGKFASITFPNLVPTLRTVALLGIVWTFNLFNVFYIFSQNLTNLGRRENWDIFITYIYNLFTQGLRGSREFSAAAALSFVVFLILVMFSRVYQKIFPEEL
jgi:ABC-type sugar transport system permease subunit